VSYPFPFFFFVSLLIIEILIDSEKVKVDQESRIDENENLLRDAARDFYRLSPEDENSSIFHVLFDIVRCNILKIGITLTPKNFLIIDQLALGNFLISSISPKSFSIPVFSVKRVLQYIHDSRMSHSPSDETRETEEKSAKQKALNLDPFTENIYLMLMRACLFLESNVSTSFERFIASFEWLRNVVLAHKTFKSFIMANKRHISGSNSCSLDRDSSFPSISDESKGFDPSKVVLLNDLYPFPLSFGMRNNQDIKIIPTLGRLIDRETGKQGAFLRPGDVFLPSNSANPGFDVLTMHRACFMEEVDGKLQLTDKVKDLVILIECKYSAYEKENSLSISTVEKKMSVTKKFYDSEDGKSFQFDGLSVPWSQVVVVFLSSYPRFDNSEPNAKGDDNKMSKEKIEKNLNSFPGLIRVSQRDSLSGMLGKPLNDCGALLQLVSNEVNQKTPIVFKPFSQPTSPPLSK